MEPKTERPMGVRQLADCDEFLEGKVAQDFLKRGVLEMKAQEGPYAVAYQMCYSTD